MVQACPSLSKPFSKSARSLLLDFGKWVQMHPGSPWSRRCLGHPPSVGPAASVPHVTGMGPWPWAVCEQHSSQKNSHRRLCEHICWFKLCPRDWRLQQLWERRVFVIYSWGQQRARARKFVLQQFVPYLVYRCKQKVYTSVTELSCTKNIECKEEERDRQEQLISILVP